MASKKKSKIQLKRSAKNDVKNVSVPTAANKTAGAADKILKPAEKQKKKPFGGKGGRKRKPKPVDPRIKFEIDQIEREESEANEANEADSLLTAKAERPESAFFYSNDKWIQAFEDEDVVALIRTEYPEFHDKAASDQILRKIIIKLLDNDQLMLRILDSYDMNIYDFFKFLYRNESALFNSLFVTRIQRVLKGKKYAGRTRKNN